MSGGSYDYLFSADHGRLIDYWEAPLQMARRIRDRISGDDESAIYTNPERGWRRLELDEKRALEDACAELEEFGEWLRAVVTRLRARRKRMDSLLRCCEWVESGDYGLDAIVDWVRKEQS